LIAIAAVWGLHQALDIVVVPTASMERTVMVGDHLLVNRWAYRYKQVHRGDVVSFYPPGKARGIFLKRVVGTGGDVVESRDGDISVNGSPLKEPYAQHICPSCEQQPTRITVPEGHLYLLGDNRDRSEDSRFFGTVPVQNVVGEPVMIMWSFAIPTRDWLAMSPVTVYLSHPHLRWTRFLKPVQ